MSVTLSKPNPAVPDLPDHLPDHLELPEENGEFVQNFRELPQSLLLSSAIWPIWLRWYYTQGNLHLIGDERVEEERRRAEEERRRADGQQRRAEQLAVKLRELGVDPAAIEADAESGSG